MLRLKNNKDVEVELSALSEIFNQFIVIVKVTDVEDFISYINLFNDYNNTETMSYIDEKNVEHVYNGYTKLSSISFQEDRMRAVFNFSKK